MEQTTRRRRGVIRTLRAVGRRLMGRRPRRAPDDPSLRARIATAGGRIPAAAPAGRWREWQNHALRTPEDVDAAVAELRNSGFVRHPDRAKNWDLLIALGTILETTARDARILEMGAAKYSPLLVCLYQMGYRRLHGIDLVWPGLVRHGPIEFDRMDLTHTTFETGSFDAIACLSVIEHGVDVGAYLSEAKRLLRPGGVLVTSTDYWTDPIDTRGREAYGRPVHVFDRSEIDRLLVTAASIGLHPTSRVDLGCRDRVVHWERMDLDYTFLELTLVSGPSDRDAP